MIPRSPLDDPAKAAHAWARYRRMLRLTALAALAMEFPAMGAIYAWFGRASIHVFIATALVIALVPILTIALMGLVFLSSGTGHDQAIADPLEDEPRS
jgi:hypothetical protein